MKPTPSTVQKTNPRAWQPLGQQAAVQGRRQVAEAFRVARGGKHSPGKGQPRGNWHVRAGFTVIELIIVIVILGILSVFAAPRFLGTGGIDEVTARGELTALLREVQQRAMQDTANPCYGVELDNAVGEARFFSPAECAIPAPQLNPVQLADGLSFNLNDPAGLAASERFLFNARGCPVPESHADSTANGVFAEPCAQGALQINITGSSTREVCIQSQGYITPSACP